MIIDPFWVSLRKSWLLKVPFLIKILYERIHIFFISLKDLMTVYLVWSNSLPFISSYPKPPPPPPPPPKKKKKNQRYWRITKAFSMLFSQHFKGTQKLDWIERKTACLIFQFFRLMLSCSAKQYWMRKNAIVISVKPVFGMVTP